MTVVLDTNVIVAAFAARGLCQAVFELCLDQHRIAASPHLLSEVRKNLLKKIKMSKSKVDEIIGLLTDYSMLITPQALQTQICRDPSDDRILELARGCSADYLVTGDKDLLVLEQFESIPIVSPRQFWANLKQQTKLS